jgi:2-methylcitrate dehydratase PrpD
MRGAPVAQRLAELVLLSEPQRAAGARASGSRLLLDIAGLCVAARRQDYVRAVLDSIDGTGPCTAIGHTVRFDVHDAAPINGVAAHGEDFDDTCEGGPVHAGAVIVPAALACCERHGLGGEDLLRAIAVGTEVTCRLCRVAPTRIHKAGFHPTAILGVIGATAAVGAALRVRPEVLVNAFGIAGSLAAGIIEYLADGSWTKRLHPGWAAQSGHRAVRLASGGFIGPRTVFEGNHGLFKGFASSRDGDYEAMFDAAKSGSGSRSPSRMLCGPRRIRHRLRTRRSCAARSTAHHPHRLRDCRRHRASAVEPLHESRHLRTGTRRSSAFRMR